MNAERLKELTERAERANQLASDIERLNKANPHAFSVDIRFRPDGTNSSGEFLELLMLKDILERGRRSLIADKEAELEQLLGGQPESAAVPVVFLPQFSVASVPQNEPAIITPNTATPLPQPFAELTCQQP